MKISLLATAQAMSQAEIEEIVDPQKLNEIKTKEEHPEIKVFSVGHEGDANLTFPGMGHRVTTFLKGAVNAIYEKLPISTPLFEKHEPTGNEHEGRVKIGEVVGKSLQNIGDKLNVLAAVYVYPQFKQKPFNVASIETNIATETDGVANWPVAIDKISGIALGNSATDKPGFPEATLVGAMQAFAGEGNNVMNIQDIKNAVATGQHKPSDIFDAETLKADNIVVEHIKTEKHDLWNQNQRHLKEMDELKGQITSADETHAKETKTLKSENLVLKSTGVLGAIIGERKLPEPQAKYLTSELTNFRTEATDEATMKEDLNKFVDTGLEKLKSVAEILGVKVVGENENSQNTETNETNAHVNPQNQTSEAPFRGDLSDPGKNNLIPGGAAEKAAQIV